MSIITYSTPGPFVRAERAKRGWGDKRDLWPAGEMGQLLRTRPTRSTQAPLGCGASGTFGRKPGSRRNDLP